MAARYCKPTPPEDEYGLIIRGPRRDVFVLELDWLQVQTLADQEEACYEAVSELGRWLEQHLPSDGATLVYDGLHGVWRRRREEEAARVAARKAARNGR